MVSNVMWPPSMPPLQVADAVFEAIRKEQFYILSHPEWIEAVQLRTDPLLRVENPQSPAETVMRLIGLSMSKK